MAAATLAVVPSTAVPPRRPSLVECIGEVECILDTLDGLEDNSLSEDAREDLGNRLIDAIAGTKAKVDSICRVLASFEAAAAAAKAERDRLDARMKYFVRQTERLERYILDVLEARGLTKLEGFTSTLKAQKNPVRGVVDDERAIPFDYKRSPEIPADVPDKKAIGAAWKNGVEVPGTHLEQTNRLVRS